MPTPKRSGAIAGQLAASVRHVDELADKLAMSKTLNVSTCKECVSTCKECGCTTGGGQYCYEHAPFTVYPLKDGTCYVDRNGQRTHVLNVDVVIDSIVTHHDDDAWEPPVVVLPIRKE